MHYGVVLPLIGLQETLDLTVAAERSGWGAVFVADCINVGTPGTWDPTAGTVDTWDPWVLLAAMAVQTERVRLGTMITPLSRRRPWKVARETVTLDHLSRGRLVLPVGLGALDDYGFGGVGDATDRRTRAELLDEGLAILAGLWSGTPFSFVGQHYQLAETTFLPPPVQQPRIPVWVVGGWPRERSMRRVLQWDGLLPNKLTTDGAQEEITPADIRAMKAWVDARREAATPFDIVMEGSTPANDRAAALAIAQEWADAGCAWWLDSFWTTGDVGAIRERVEAGPPE
jgi:alkanesulfonate monooxygenase SsuD/methylene tetrahydromethanopterin reductase-like flavin-dependent oxidoreductase (luciferase family)